MKTTSFQRLTRYCVFGKVESFSICGLVGRTWVKEGEWSVTLLTSCSAEHRKFRQEKVVYIPK